jgi:hypothetical protein
LHLKVLYISRCGLTEVEGIGSLCGLEELYLAFNDVSDLSPLTALEALTVLDCESNRVAELSQVQFLVNLPRLASLNLEGNPVETLPGFKRSIAVLLPRLETLNDRPVSPCEGGAEGRDGRDGGGDERAEGIISSPPGKMSALDPEVRIVMDALKYCKIEEDVDEVPDVISALSFGASGTLERPRSAFSRESARSRSARGPGGGFASGMASARTVSSRASSSSSSSSRPMTARGFPAPRHPWGLSTAPNSASSSSSFYASSMPEADPLGSSSASASARLGGASSSELTFGSDDVFCGNVVKSLRARGRAATSSDLMMQDTLSLDGGAGLKGLLPGIQAAGDADVAILEQLVAWKLTSGIDEMRFAGELSAEMDAELLSEVERTVIPPSAPRSARPQVAGRVLRARESSASSQDDHQAPPPAPPQPYVSGMLRPQLKEAITVLRQESN